MVTLGLLERGTHHLLNFAAAVQVPTFMELVLVESFLTALGEIKAVNVHHLSPYGDEVLNKLFLRILTCIHFRNRSELRVRTEEQIGACRGPFEFARAAIVSLIHTAGAVGSRLPLRVHVEQVHEEIIRQRLRTRGKDAVPRLPKVRSQ